jgi:ribonuclease T
MSRFFPSADILTALRSAILQSVEAFESAFVHPNIITKNFAERFRGYLPVVVDIETGGFDSAKDALLEIAAVPLGLGANGLITPLEAISTHVNPFPGANIDPRSLEITGIDVDNPLRGALDEREALEQIFVPIRKVMKTFGCKRAILVGHNAHFDLNFLNAALRRTGNKKSPFHPFSVMDTVTLAGIFYGQTVLAKSLWAAGLEWDSSQAHSALYDASRTAELFCLTVNRLRAISESSAMAIQPAGVEPVDSEEDAKAEVDLD